MADDRRQKTELLPEGEEDKRSGEDRRTLDPMIRLKYYIDAGPRTDPVKSGLGKWNNEPRAGVDLLVIVLVAIVLCGVAGIVYAVWR